MSSGRCGLCGNKFGQRAEELVHSDCVDEMNRKVDRLRERLDQFEAYGFPNVAAALDRVNAAESRLARLEEALREIAEWSPTLQSEAEAGGYGINLWRGCAAIARRALAGGGK